MRKVPTTLCEFLRWLDKRAKPESEHPHIKGGDKVHHSSLVFALAEEFIEEKYGKKCGRVGESQK